MTFLCSANSDARIQTRHELPMRRSRGCRRTRRSNPGARPSMACRSPAHIQEAVGDRGIHRDARTVATLARRARGERPRMLQKGRQRWRPRRVGSSLLLSGIGHRHSARGYRQAERSLIRHRRSHLLTLAKGPLGKNGFFPLPLSQKIGRRRHLYTFCPATSPDPTGSKRRWRRRQAMPHSPW
jgi:hypothetical protein